MHITCTVDSCAYREQTRRDIYIYKTVHVNHLSVIGVMTCDFGVDTLTNSGVEGALGHDVTSHVS